MTPREMASRLERIGYCSCGCGARSSMPDDGRELLARASAMLVALSEEAERTSTLIRQMMEEANDVEIGR